MERFLEEMGLDEGLGDLVRGGVLFRDRPRSLSRSERGVRLVRLGLRDGSLKRLSCSRMGLSSMRGLNRAE